LVHTDGASVQGHWSVQITGLGRAGALTKLRLDLPDRAIQILDQEIKKCGQPPGLHFGDDLECGFASIKLVNNLHVRHVHLLQDGGQSI
jgi:hypothetical protein